MSTIQFIERNGKREYAVVPMELFARLMRAAESLDDVALFDAVKAADDGFRVPGAVAHAILDGVHPGRGPSRQGLARTPRIHPGHLGREGRHQQGLSQPDRDGQADGSGQDSQSPRIGAGRDAQRAAALSAAVRPAASSALPPPTGRKHALAGRCARCAMRPEPGADG